MDYHAEFADLQYRPEQAHWSYKYLQGLMLPIECKAIQPMAMALEGGNIQAVQQFIGQGQWQDEKLLKKHWQLADETLGEEDGVWIADGSGFPKKGEDSVVHHGRTRVVHYCRTLVVHLRATIDTPNSSSLTGPDTFCPVWGAPHG